MSKKIISLLSLLIFLSLVFASCKQNGITGIKGDLNKEEEIKMDTGGIINSWSSLEGKTILNDYSVISAASDKDYYRNPVVVALGGANVLIITEKRIGFKGTDLDTGVDGQNKVDIMYLLSTDSGDNFSGPYTVGEKSTGANDAVSDPVVYYKRDSGKIYIIASSGAGLSRTRDYYYDRRVKSKFRYIVGTVSGTDAKASIDWSAGWKDLDLPTSKLGIKRHIQFGTHSARGVMSKDGSTLVLTVITADLNYTGLEWEAMGAQFFKVTEANGTLTVGDKIGVTIEIPVPTYERASIFKEAEAVDYDDNKVDYMIVPNPRFRTTMGKGNSTYNSVSEVSGLKAAEGSFGYLKLKGGWFGTNQYDPSTYLNTNAADAILFSHVASDAGTSYMYMLDEYYTPKGNSLQIAKTSKASSIDVLPDGTIIMASEKERDTSAAGYKFRIFFSRYTQAYLASKLE